MLNTEEFIRYYSDENDITLKQSREEIDRFLETVKTAISDKGGVFLKNFAKFFIETKKERNGYNPQTKKAMIIPAKKRLKIKISENLKMLAEE